MSEGALFAHDLYFDKHMTCFRAYY